MDFRIVPKQMFDATCDKCKQACQVPFNPKPGKPVLCLACFKAKKAAEAQGDAA
ncbi:hypothetical protein HY492_03610 [Candidatus Woesearchaeota archaeon]|nr:hypothetical protein [Candidatus Woesearchaeota archaeon]